MGLVSSIIYQISFLLALSMIFSLTHKRIDNMNFKFRLFAGIVIGLMGVGVMYNPYVFVPGFVFDVRSILICITGLFIGFVPTAITVMITAAFRIYQGGVGTVTGVSVIFFSASLGLLWRKLYYKELIDNRKSRIPKLCILGIVTHAVMLACMLLTPWETALSALKYISVPVIILYPFGTVLLGLLMFNQIDGQNVVKQLKESEERYKSIFYNTHTIMMLIEPETQKLLDANPAAAKFYGWTVEELKNKSVHDIDILSQEETTAEIESASKENRSHYHFRHKLAGGEVRNVDVYSSRIYIDGKRVILSLVHDITERVTAQRQLKESEERLRITLLSVGDGVIATDREGNITLLNKAAKDITGWGDDALGKPISSIFNIINEDSGASVDDPIKKVFETGNIVGLANHTVLICADGARKPIADSAAPIKDDEGNVLGAVLIIRDVTEERKSRKEIEYLGYHDPLTGLYNRRFFDEALKWLDDDKNLPISIIVGDVNSLKLTNDAFGHSEGDRLLKEMAHQIADACSNNDIVARWGGDEFIIMLPKTDEKSAESVCNKIRQNCSSVRMSEISLSISLGYETKHDPGMPIDDVIKRAEDYMFRNKSTSSASLRRSNIEAILLALHEKSPRERQHSNRVGELCRAIGRAMDLSEKDIDELALAGLMHDIGKIAITDTILNKEGKLTESEWDEMKRHPEIGYRILSAANNMAYIAQYVLMHHERLDGTGYPHGVLESDIPLQSRILAIADSFDAMTSARPYRAPLDERFAARELINCSGSQFDPEIVDLFVKKVLKISVM